MSTILDLNFVRDQFPAFSEPSLQGQVHFENAGGSYACRQVIDRLCDYYRSTKVQPYYPFNASALAGEQMDQAYTRLAEYLNVDADDVHVGPSTSQNTVMLAQAFRGHLQPGDEIIVTNQDHEANIGAWRKLADSGVVIREWTIDPITGMLDIESLNHLLTEKTRLVAFTHCSNLIGHINPVAQICKIVRDAGAISIVDGVSFAGHGFPDVPSLGADIYLFSTYKTYGPHQGIMIIRKAIAEQLGNQAHFFNHGFVHKRLVPAGPDHAQVAALNGVAEYFDALHEHHFGIEDLAQRPEKLRHLMRRAELVLLPELMEFLVSRKNIRVLGPVAAEQRSATVSCIIKNADPIQVGRSLADHGIMAGAGHFYAYRALQGLGEDPERGALRLSFLHYTSHAEMDKLLGALDAVL